MNTILRIYLQGDIDEPKTARSRRTLALGTLRERYRRWIGGLEDRSGEGWVFPQTPTSSSWLNMVERFFRDLTQNRIRRGIFRDVEELIMAIGDYIDKHNHRPKPFVWTAKASDILEKVKRARVALDNR